jgi:hypothetical protein
MLSWQTIVVALIILAAAVYVGRLAWDQIRAFGKESDGDACAKGCGNCPGTKTPVFPAKQIIQLSRSKSPLEKY